MKKATLSKFAVAAALSIAAIGAYAQSSVTLYGRLDESLVYTNNQAGKPNTQLYSGAIGSSLFGLKGSEDIGGGNHVIFTLENNFNLNNGNQAQAGREFAHGAYVGIQNDKYGTVTLGRQYDSQNDLVGPLTLTDGVGGNFFAHPYDNDNLDASFMINNSVKYQSNPISGVTVSGTYGFSNNGEFANSRVYSVAASYANGPLTVAGGYLQVNNDVNNYRNDIGEAGAVAGENTFVAGTQRTFSAGASYVIGNATVGAVYSQTNLLNAQGIASWQAGTASDVPLNGSVRFQNIEINGQYQLSPSLSLAGNYVYTRANFGGGVNPNFNQVGAQLDYKLSKSTDLYVESLYQHVSSNSVVKANIMTWTSASTTNSQVVGVAGIKHSF